MMTADGWSSAVVEKNFTPPVKISLEEEKSCDLQLQPTGRQQSENVWFSFFLFSEKKAERAACLLLLFFLLFEMFRLIFSCLVQVLKQKPKNIF